MKESDRERTPFGNLGCTTLRAESYTQDVNIRPRRMDLTVVDGLLRRPRGVPVSRGRIIELGEITK